MFVQPEQSLELSMKVLNRQPTGRLLWYTLPRYFNNDAAADGFTDGIDFMTRELGAVSFENLVCPFRRVEPDVEIVDTKEGPDTVRQYRSPWGTLTERRRQNEIIGHRVNNADELRTLIEMYKNIETTIDADKFDSAVDRIAGRGPVGMAVATSSLQRMLQHDLGVANFWFAISDTPELLEEAMEIYQAKLQPSYDALDQFDADWYYHGENTSTTAISPEYYSRYSIKHIRQYTDAVARTGKTAVVHMCGLLNGLVPLFPETGMHGIDCLTTPPVGDCELKYAYETMGDDFFCTGRFGSNMWIGRSREEILANLAAVITHEIYQQHPFVMIVTTDEVKNIPLENWRLLRDCINEYEQV